MDTADAGQPARNGAPEQQPGARRGVIPLALGALGIVYGDIGTSPLYALRECFHGFEGIEPTPVNVLGVLSLIFWSLAIVISLKYLAFVMRAHNRGEGGIIALVALLNPWHAASTSRRGVLMLLGLFGAALLYGDGTITPAISVLSAVEGLKVATPAFEPYVIPITVAILVGLFMLQKRGTARVGALFGPAMLAWFVVLALLGVAGLVRAPEVLAAVNPWYGIAFFANNGWTGFLVLGTVFLVVTGGEALYADMGHFGLPPIRLAWFALVLPALLANYFGQGALLLDNPQTQQPFYDLAPDWCLYPLVVLATVATVIASQAVISGVFSLTRQAVQLGQLPRMTIVQTSQEAYGQIYIPLMNWLLMAATIGLVIGFGSSSNLAAAYGVAVSTDMVITTILAFFVAQRFGWSLRLIGLLAIIFIVVDLAFFGANLLKIPQGGWYPLAVGLLIFGLMATWRRGRQLLGMHLRQDTEPLADFLARIARKPPVRVPGTAVFMTARGSNTPPMLLHHLTHNQVLHEQVVLLTIKTDDIPRVPAAERLHIEMLEQGFCCVTAHYGFVQHPSVPVVLKLATKAGLEIDLEKITYYVGTETIVPTAEVPGMMVWRERLFAFLSRNATRANSFYGIPSEHVVVLGIQVEI